MGRNDSYWIVTAEASPIIRAGLSACLRRLPGVGVQPVEAHSLADIESMMTPVRSHPAPVMIIVNPTFGGGFDPVRFRVAHGSDVKLAALEVGRLDRQTLASYDGVISIVDDLSTIADTISTLLSEENSQDTDEDDAGSKDVLSQREKEIVTLVVKGLTNKEIATRLFLSIHTVITHRRNISRKLEIHSATGLTIYAIVNKLVDINEIRL